MKVVEYAVNLICAATMQPFVVHVYLGQVPKVINYGDASAASTWVGSIAHTGPFDSFDYSPVADENSAIKGWVEDAVSYPFLLTRSLEEKLPQYPWSELSSEAASLQLAGILHWRLVPGAAYDRGEMPARNLKGRIWVTRTEYVVARDGRRTPVKSHILWAAAGGNPGALQRNELTLLQRARY